MDKAFPKKLHDAIEAGAWRDPGPSGVRRLLGDSLELPDLELFEDTETMQRVAAQLDQAGYVDDPEFCMVRRIDLGEERREPRLLFGDAVFIAGSKVPGDDVFVVIDCRDPNQEATVRVFDWRAAVPLRWVPVATLSELLRRLSRVLDEKTSSS